jgi:hypothetical protein
VLESRKPVTFLVASILAARWVDLNLQVKAILLRILRSWVGRD